MQPQKIMNSFIDKLGDHLPIDRVKLLIDNGFDEWETISYLKGEELVQLGFDLQECIVIMVAANANAQENGLKQIFDQVKMQEVMAKAKENDTLKQQKILREEEQYKNMKKQQQNSNKSIPSAQNIKEYPQKQITEVILMKGTFSKTKTGEKVNLSKATVVDLQQKQLTHIANMDKCPNLTNLNLGNNYIYQLQGLQFLTKIKVLKLQHNNISEIKGLQNLVNLEHLNLSANYISRLQNLQNNKKIQQIYISKQKINGNFTFQQQSIISLAYTLQKLECNQNKVKSITQLKYLVVVKQVYLMKNQLQDVGELSQTISGMQSIKLLSFKDNPLTKSQKYRDYIVILSKTLEQLDGKKILAKQREYLVKLYALKHAKQTQEQKPKTVAKGTGMNLKGTKVEQQYGYGHLNKATDLRGNMPYANTKVTKG